MELNLVVLSGIAAALLLVLGSFVLLAGARQDHELQEKLRNVSKAVASPAARKSSRGSSPLDLLRRIGELLRDRALISERDLLDVERTVAAAGFDARRAVPTFIGIKVALFFVTPAATFAFASLQGTGNEIAWTAGGAVVGLLSPNWVLGFMRRKHLAELRRGLPDALDMLVVCTEAGLGLDTAVERVARELGRSNRAVAEEFSLLGYELRVLPDRRMALTRLAERTPLEQLQRLAGTLAQTFRFGTPLAQALRVLANESRQDRMLRLETKAARLPALMVLPLILFIMPCLFIVLIGPSVVTLSERLGG
jgi:tight adherence protein C